MTMYDHTPHEHDDNANRRPPYTIQVGGEGQVTAPPDRAVITLGVITEGMQLRAAQADNAAVTTQVIQSIRQLNIPSEQIQTVDYRIDTEYDYIDGKQLFRGYKVSHLLQITTDNIGQAGAIVDTAVESGANNVAGIRYTITNRDLYEKQALALAVRNAVGKAAAIAHAMGVAIDPVPIQVQELTGESQAPFASPAMLKSSAATPLSPGSLTIAASLLVWFNRY